MLTEKAENFIRAAEEDLCIMEDSRYFDFKSANAVCFHAQQYAEKMIKAKIALMGIEPPRSHDLSDLLDLLEDSPSLLRARDCCEILSQYEVSTRYPNEIFRYFSPEEAEEAYYLALEIPNLIGLFDTSDSDKIISKCKKKRLFFRWGKSIRPNTGRGVWPGRKSL